MLSVTTAAADRSLLTLAELRAAAGVPDNSRDAELTTLGARVAAAITAACQVARGGAVPPTLRLETLTETHHNDRHRAEIVLSRRPVVSVTSVTEIDTVLTSADYEIEAGTGLLRRLAAGRPWCWPCRKVVIVYQAGWQTVPDDLKLAAAKFVQAEWQQGSRDPLLRRVKVEGISEREYWVDPTKDSVIPAEVMDILERGGYVNYWVS